MCRIVKTGAELGIYTFEDAFDYFQTISEKYSHIEPVKMVYTKGNFVFEYTKENQ